MRANADLLHGHAGGGVDGNTISYELYKQLKGVELKETTTTFKSFIGHKITPHGVCMLQVFVDELAYGDKFFVTQVGLQDVPVILGRTWQRKHNCFFNWEKKLVHCQSADNKLWVPLHQPMLDLVECSSKDQEEARELTTKKKTMDKARSSSNSLQSNKQVNQKNKDKQNKTYDK